MNKEMVLMRRITLLLTIYLSILSIGWSFAQQKPEGGTSSGTSPSPQSSATQSNSLGVPSSGARTTRPSPPLRRQRPPSPNLAQILGPLPRKRVSMDFRGADIDNVLLFFSMQSGITILKDPSLTGPVTLINARKIPLLEAFRILEALLNQKNFTLQREGPLLRVVPKGPPSQPSPPPQGPQPPTPPPEPKEVKETKVYPLKYASARAVANIINELFRESPAPGQPGGPPGGPPPGGPPGGPPGQQPKKPSAKASADDFTNSVLVVADQELIPDIDKIVQQVDQPTETPLETRVFTLQYADATEMALQIGPILQTLQSAGRGAVTPTGMEIPFERRVFFGSSAPTSTAGGRVIADVRTNSLIVTASKEVLDKIEDIIKKLDVPVEYQSTTEVIPLKNADASEVTFLLGQLFQEQRRPQSFFELFFFGGPQQQRGQVRQRFRLGDPRSSRPRTQRGSSPFFPGASQERLNNEEGFLMASLFPPGELLEEERGAFARPFSLSQGKGPTREAERLLQRLKSLAVQSGRRDYSSQTFTTSPAEEEDSETNSGQFEFEPAQFFGFELPRRGSETQVGRDPQGRIRPLVNLPGNVTIVPDLNTNSLIINTTPSNMEALKQLISQMDVVPAQVLIEAIIVEAVLDKSTKLSLRLNLTETNPFGQKGAGATTTIDLPVGGGVQGGLRYSIIGASFDALLQALRSDRRFNVLQTPRILTQNNRQAAINISQAFPILRSTTTFGAAATNIDFIDIGIILDVTPHITPGDYVNIEVSQEANEIQGFTTLNNNQVPIIAQRNTETTVTVKDGQTIIISGLIKDTVTRNENRIPILSDIPLIGHLFRSIDKQRSKTELMIFLTPHIVKNPAEVQDLTFKQREQLHVKPRFPEESPPKEKKP